MFLLIHHFISLFSVLSFQLGFIINEFIISVCQFLPYCSLNICPLLLRKNHLLYDMKPLLYLQIFLLIEIPHRHKSMGNIYKLYHLYPTCIASGKHLLLPILYTVYLTHSTTFINLSFTL